MYVYIVYIIEGDRSVLLISFDLLFERFVLALHTHTHTHTHTHIHTHTHTHKHTHTHTILNAVCVLGISADIQDLLSDWIK